MKSGTASSPTPFWKRIAILLTGILLLAEIVIGVTGLNAGDAQSQSFQELAEALNSRSTLEYSRLLGVVRIFFGVITFGLLMIGNEKLKEKQWTIIATITVAVSTLPFFLLGANAWPHLGIVRLLLILLVGTLLISRPRKTV